MSTTVKTGWLKDSNGEKFAPKTLISQVQASDGSLLEDKISDLNNRLQALEEGGVSTHPYSGEVEVV